MTQRILLFALSSLLLTFLMPTAQAGDPVKDLKRVAGTIATVKGFVEPDDERFGELSVAIEAVGKEDNASAAKMLLQIMRMPCESVSVEVTIAEKATEALKGMTSKPAQSEVRKALSKGKKDPELAASLAEMVAAHQSPQSAKALGELLESKNPQVVMSGARGLGNLRMKEGIKPLIDVFGDWQKRGGEPINVIGRALYDITGQALATEADWTKWWKEAGKTWDPSQRATDSDTATSQRKTFQDPKDKIPPSVFEGVDMTSKKIVIIIDTSGSMHIRNYIHEEVEDSGEKGSEKNGGTSLSGPVNKAPKLKFDPRKDGYKKKKCTFHQCPYAKGSTDTVCPNDQRLPKWFSRMNRLSRKVQTVVESFRRDVEFQIVRFSTDASTFKGMKLMKATSGNKKKAIAWLKGLKADGFTNSEKGIKKAFKVPSADTFIFVTDGAPTNQSGRPFPAKRQRELLDFVKRKNRKRQVVINVVAISEGHTDFSNGLAEENKGTYVVVD